MSKILVLSSQIHQDLSSKQLTHCIKLVEQSDHDFQVEIVKAGTYELPFVINAYQRNNPFDGYIALGLVLTSNLNHYDYIMSHIKYCFTHFALNNVIVGNGIISGSSVEDLAEKIESQNPCLCAYPSAFQAVDYLIQLRKKMNP